jgi:hypothetical protein
MGSGWLAAKDEDSSKAIKLNCYREYLIQHDSDQEVRKNED